jgi:AAA+ ATPase superfamily predicted ATPase
VQFHDRGSELEYLEGQARPDRPALVVLYGRRRVGKTALLRHFAAERRSVFFVADTTSRADQLAAFSATVFRELGETALEETVFPSWEAALRFLAGRAAEAPLLLVLDEFQYLCAGDPALPSIIQRLWDAELQSTRLHVVLCGSYVSFMEREVLGAKNPLYGRRTGEFLLAPLRFRDAQGFFPGVGMADRVTAFGILGGVPAYLERFQVERTIRRNVLAEILSPGAPLYSEPRFLMMEEVRDPRIYFSVCRAVAFGRTTPNEIAQGAGLSDRGAVSRYLDTLRALRLLERRTPVTERNPERSRRGRYRVSDPLFRFWFRFVLPNRSALEAGDPAQVYRAQVAPRLEQHVAIAFEEICEQHLWFLNVEGQLPRAYDRLGGWWRADQEVDLVAVSDSGGLLLGECKWTRRPVGTNVLEALIGKTAAVQADLKSSADEVSYALWSRSGFTPALERRARDAGVLLLDLEALRTV